MVLMTSVDLNSRLYWVLGITNDPKDLFPSNILEKKFSHKHISDNNYTEKYVTANISILYLSGLSELFLH